MYWYIEYRPVVDFLAPIFQFLLALAIGGLGTVIAIGQLNTAKRKLRLDLFEHRVKVIDDLDRVISSIAASGAGVQADIVSLWEIEKKATLFFSADTPIKVKAVRDVVLALQALKQTFDPSALQAKRVAHVARDDDLWKAYQDSLTDLRNSLFSQSRVNWD